MLNYLWTLQFECSLLQLQLHTAFHDTQTHLHLFFCFNWAFFSCFSPKQYLSKTWIKKLMPQSLSRARKRKGKLKLFNFNFTSNDTAKWKKIKLQENLYYQYFGLRTNCTAITKLTWREKKKVCRNKVQI